MKILLALVSFVALAQAAGPTRTLTLREYNQKVQGAWMGQIVGAIFGWPFEGTVKNVVNLDRYLESAHFKLSYHYAPVDDDYFYEMIALYGFERFGLNMSVEQLGEMWKEHQAGAWGSSMEARLWLARGGKAPDTGHPRHNKWFHTIGPQFSADMYGMIAPGMVNLAGSLARRYSHVNGYAEGSDGAVFVAACVSEAFFEKDPEKIVRKAVQLIDPRSNYRQAIEQVLEGHARGLSFQELARQTEDRWRPDYPQMNNSVPNGALVAIGLLYGGGDFMRTLNVTTQLADFADADCNAANAGAVIGAMHGIAAIPEHLQAQFRDRIWGESMGPIQFRKPIDEKISDLSARIAVVGRRNLLANGATQSGASEPLQIPDAPPRTQPYEHFDINDYGALWNPAWHLAGAGRGGAGTTFLNGDVLATFPRDIRPCRLETQVEPSPSQFSIEVKADPGKPWLLEIFVYDTPVIHQTIDTAEWRTITVALPAQPSKRNLRLYQQPIDDQPHQAYWRNPRFR